MLPLKRSNSTLVRSNTYPSGENAEQPPLKYEKICRGAHRVHQQAYLGASHPWPCKLHFPESLRETWYVSDKVWRVVRVIWCDFVDRFYCSSNIRSTKSHETTPMLKQTSGVYLEGMPAQIFASLLSRLSVQKLLKPAVADSEWLQPERVVSVFEGFQVARLPLITQREFLSLKI